MVCPCRSLAPGVAVTRVGMARAQRLMGPLALLMVKAGGVMMATFARLCRLGVGAMAAWGRRRGGVVPPVAVGRRRGGAVSMMTRAMMPCGMVAGQGRARLRGLGRGMFVGVMLWRNGRRVGMMPRHRRRHRQRRYHHRSHYLFAHTAQFPPKHCSLAHIIPDLAGHAGQNIALIRPWPNIGGLPLSHKSGTGAQPRACLLSACLEPKSGRSGTASGAAIPGLIPIQTPDIVGGSGTLPRNMAVISANRAQNRDLHRF